MATSLEPTFYQKLLERCWRRSGTLLYKPNQRSSCCPHYTLRLDAASFRATKDQRQAINRFNKYVTGEKYAREAARLYPLSREQARKRDNEFDLVARIHEAEADSLKTPPEPAHRFTVTLEPDTFTEEKYAVFENYQRIVHQEGPDKISRRGFQRFLCDSPLRRGTVVDEGGTKRKVGSFHQCYRLDGKLVAIGVLDLLPTCVSAVYFLYHESIHSLNPGKLGALREIALAREMGYGWWYPGYYIHSCPKMKYKIDYSPQYVLDPETYTWDLLDKEALAVFDKKSYVSLSRERREAAAGSGDTANSDTTTSQNQAEMSTSEEAGEDDKDDDSGGENESLLESNMPGIPSLQQMEALDMDTLLLRLDSDNFFLASDLVVWDTDRISKHGSLKCTIAELIAAIGPDLLGEVCLDFRRRNRS